MKDRDVVLCHPVRTAIGTFGGSLKEIPATDLGAAVIRETIRRSEVAVAVGAVIMGNVIQAGNRMNPARQAALHGGVAVSVPALTVNRVCGSGAQAILSAAQEILLGNVQVAISGGMENMDRAPYLLSGGRWGYRMGDAQIQDSMLLDGLNDAFSGEHSGWHTEDLVTKIGLTREQQDRWAERSQQRFAAAQSAGKFEREIVAVEMASKKGPTVFARDEHPRPDTTLATLAKLRPAFRKDGTITAGNSPGLNSGAAAVVVAERSYAETCGLRPMARLVSYGLGAVEPGMFGLGPVPAVHQALAAVPLAVSRELGLPQDIVNVEGGAIAHGHPIGATGAVLTTRLLHSLTRDGLKRGLVTMCIGGGQGIALTFEIL
jgi:acetyl-CoA C-acetyltransferase